MPYTKRPGLSPAQKHHLYYLSWYDPVIRALKYRHARQAYLRGRYKSKYAPVEQLSLFG